MSGAEVTAAVERLAKALAQLEPDEPWPTNAELGGNLTGTRDDEFRDGKRDEARELLDAAYWHGSDIPDFFDGHRESFGPDGEANYGCTCTSGRVDGGYRVHAVRALRTALLGGVQ